MEAPFFTGLSKFKVDIGKFRRDDDQSDRFSHFFTTILLVCFSLVVSTRQYVGKPIACWVPTEFTSAQEEYAESICWVSSTYFISLSQSNIPDSTQYREDRKIRYYQWVPFILMLQAVLFNFPCCIWRLLNWQSGVNLSSIIDVANDTEMIKEYEQRKNNIVFIARHIDDSLHIQREYRHGCSVQCRHCLAQHCCMWFGRRYGNYLVCVYTICKSLYILNVIGQFFLMNRFLGTNYTFYGLDLLYQLSIGNEWTESGNFPRVALCDFQIRKLANQHRYTVQCVLPINMFNEKIFIFLWFWFLFVALLSVHSFVQWTFKSVCRVQRFHFVRKFLVLKDALNEAGDRKKLRSFVDLFLQQDGIFILRLLALNCGQLVAADVTASLWCRFKESARSESPDRSKLYYLDNDDVYTKPKCQRLLPEKRSKEIAVPRRRLPSAPVLKGTLNSQSNSVSSSSNHSNASAPVRQQKKLSRANLHHVTEEDPGEFV